ncbi:MAG: LytTR family transcriptional regulator [Halobacteriovoraceae bacterium]|nr:LytTR family transcriptional regulator [Halobacteriovoraceae bacterium]
MHNENQNTNQMKETREGLKITLGISVAFFLVSIVGKAPTVWLNVFKISLGYGIPIYGMIWLSYAAIGKVVKSKDMNFGFWLSFATSFVGLTAGSFIGEILKAIVLEKETSFTQTPFIILIGSFISLMFIYRDQNRVSELEKAELNEINERLKERQSKKYLKSITSSLGNSQKVLPVSDILFFKSMDHYTHACTKEGEHIIDYSIKKLSDELDPNHFIQIHRNCIVSLSQVSSIENGNHWFVKTKTGEELKVSRNSRKKLKESLR